VGLFVAAIGSSIGLDAGIFRTAAAIMMVLIGAVPAAPRLQAWFALTASPLGEFAQARLGASSPPGIAGQFGAGLALGAVWSPCMGPTLGAASILAAQGRNFGEVALTMSLFGLGAAAPLLAIGLLSREAFARWRGHFLVARSSAKSAFGGLLMAIGLTIVSASTRRPRFLVEMSPQWLTDLTSRF
jgi:cytochrome c-type biogenesis protein